MPGLFGLDIAKIVAESIADAGGLPSIQLVKITPGGRNTTNPSIKLAATRKTHNCNGFISDYEDSQVDGSQVLQGDRKIVIIGDTLTSGVIPEPDDEIVAEATTFTITESGVTRDPAAATYTCQVRK